MRFKKLLLGSLFLLTALAVIAWTQRDLARQWYGLRGLASATDADRDAWVAFVAPLGSSAEPALIDMIRTGPETAGLNALAALSATDAPDEAGLTRRLKALSPGFAKSPASVRASLISRVAVWCTSAGGDDSFAATADLLAEAAKCPEAECQTASMELAAALLPKASAHESLLRATRGMASAGLASAEPAVRLQAIKLCLQPGIESYERIVGLLRDPVAEVRRAAIMAVGPADPAVVREDVLLPGLHDADGEVRRHTETALKARGLKPEHIDLAKLLTHADAGVRVRVLDKVREVLNEPAGDLDIDPGVWMRRLSHDTSPAVRAAALRMMSRQNVIDLSDRVGQMAANDPSPTVMEMAKYYLRDRASTLRQAGFEP